MRTSTKPCVISCVRVRNNSTTPLTKVSTPMQIVRGQDVFFNANFVHAQPRSLTPYLSGTPRAANTLARALHEAIVRQKRNRNPRKKKYVAT